MRLMELRQFKLYAYYPNCPRQNRSAETGDELLSTLDPIDAAVPGSIYDDLQRAGVIDDPYFGMNSLACEWVPERWWEYRTSFSCPMKEGRHLRLRLDGIDYLAYIRLNGREVAQSTNMHLPVKIPLDGLLRETNTLQVILENPPKEHGQIGYTSETKTQKPRFNYKWDWCVRMIGMGIDRPVAVEEFGASAIEYLRTETLFQEDGSCLLQADAELTGFEKAPQTAEFRLSFGGRTVAAERISFVAAPGESHVSACLRIEQPRLWWPAGHGEQPLYTLCVTVRGRDGEVSDTRDFTVGLRRLEFRQCDGASADSLPYVPVVNGKDIYIKGVNLTPFEMGRGMVTAERMEGVLTRAREANVNLLRIWGGGYFGTPEMYEICDRLGLLVWQEFIQSSAGLDNVPSKDPGFLRELADAAAEAVKSLRTHPSLAVFSGGNELTDAQGTPVGFDDENIALLRRIVERYDSRLMLPTSASGPHEFLDPGDPGRNHDVHGPWKYCGAEGHYDLYNRSDSQLHSEFGVDGMNGRAVLEKILPPERLRVTDMRSDAIWRHRGDWWNTYPRDTALFGAFAPEELDTFIACSQFIQAEGIRYALEANRRRAFQNTGSIIWQYNEPIPNVSGTNLEDYYGGKKLAYGFVRDAFRPCNPSLRYGKLAWQAGEKVPLAAFVSNDGAAFDARLTLRASDWQGRLLLEKAFPLKVPENGSCQVGSCELTAPASEAMVIELKLEGGGQSVTSRYVLFVLDDQGFLDRRVAQAEFEAGQASLME